MSTITPPPTPPPAFPPPSPEELSEREAGSPNRLLAILAGVGLGLAAVMTVLWLGERGDDAASESTAAADERVAALEDDLAVSEAARSASAAQASELLAQLDEANAALADAQADVDQLTAENESLRADLATAAARIAELEAELEAALAAEPAPVDAPAADDAAAETAEPGGSDAVDTVTAFDPAQTPEFARWVGELLSSRTGSSRLGAESAACFGGGVISLIGLDALGAGQHNAATGEARQVVIDAMVASAAQCGIDPGLVFG